MDMQASPWYRDTANTTPFVLSKFACSKDAPSFSVCATFPWHTRSLDSDLSLGRLREEKQDEWQEMVRTWGGSILIGSHGCAYIMHKQGTLGYVKVPRPGFKEPDSTVRAVGWALLPTAVVEPLAVIAASRSIFIVSLKSLAIVGKLKGHGDEILSIAVHPRRPYMFLTTSRDQTSRLYDLSYKPRQIPNNPHWLPAKRPSFAGTAFGMHSSEPEGEGIGRCVGVLVGGRAGGHDGAVFHAAWHPCADVIATCSMDRTVKIWRIPQVDYVKVKEDEEFLAREDKPLFSTNLLHKSRVLGIAWINSDTLISYAAPSLMRGERASEMYEAPGEVAVWQWLGYSRFLKKGQVRPIMRGSVMDYQNSESFRVHAVYALPVHCPKVHFYVSPHLNHDPMMLVPDGKIIRVFNISHFKPKTPPNFPLARPMKATHPNAGDSNTSQLAATMLQVLNVEDQADGGDPDEDDGDDPPAVYPIPKPVKKLFNEVPTWIVNGELASEVHSALPVIEVCELAWGGQAIVGVGKNGTVWLWYLRDRRP
ncbi:uncharacterized protein PHACADRAFT_111252 [Phanerochaete carnosa HHB-10118-sp]|uniref:Uncharacterized protein n=1 Tax=Phanerochaete carnosa (strain HHB-10118-sp) TaxID=650164 RepID=K5WNS9_PHACS|nr:uncharacterized protein PHACADRAFT_111252 [Phanerochaete carnosa HHB-10118-sp]EKM61110.1 hypothetical protein PHACADRAFT_111252 [Phanerochaete carnosa HHB-10118-sp]